MGRKDRKKKSTRHREAAFSRWENRTDRVQRKTRERAEDAGGVLLTALMLVASPFRWVGHQFIAAGKNLWAFLDWVTLDRVIPEGIAGQIQYLIELVPKSFGLRGTDRNTQISSSVILITLAVLASALTFGLTAAAVVLFGFGLLGGLLRMFPAGNRTWKDARSRLPIRDDYDIPKWERD